MTVDLYFICGFAIGFEMVPDPDYGGNCYIVDLGIMRFIFGWPEKE